MRGTWEFRGTEGPGDRMTAWGMQMQLLGLGMSTAKASLDLLLAGYYSVAYSAVRHMLESLLQYHYLDIHPEESPLWYGMPGQRARETERANPQKKSKAYEPPKCKVMVDHLKRDVVPLAALYDRIYGSWRLMCKGAHPSAEGVKQTTGDDDGKHEFGATYDRELSLVGFDHGLFALSLLLQALVLLKPQTEEWQSGFDDLRQEISTWRQSMASQVSTEGKIIDSFGTA